MSKDAERTPVALVTGGSSGLGSATAVHLASRGYDVLIHYHANEEAAEATRREVTAVGRRGEIVSADLTGASGADTLRESFDERFGRLDLLVNAAGAYHETKFCDISEAEWFAGLNSTATAVYFVTRSFVDLLRSSRGRVINIGDTDATTPGARMRAPGYHVGKCGVWLLTRSFAQHEAEHGVAVNMISPGLMENSSGLPEPDAVPAGRFGTMADLTAAVDMLLAGNSAYVTGSNIVVSGGWNL